LRPFKDTTSKIETPSTERLSIRTKPSVKSAIQRAAALNGVSETTFIMSAAYQAALRTIEVHERTVLKTADHATFFEALDNPPDATTILRHAFTRHRKRVQSE
jgi:uncharacterized protein (DUF1778 family)